MTKRIDRAEWVRRALSLNLEWTSEPPTRNDQKTPIRCTLCGHEWAVLPANIAKGRRNCPSCYKIASRVSVEEWQSRILDLGSIWLEGTPETLADLDKWAKCLKCGSDWKVNPRRLYKGAGHPRCSSTKPQGLLPDSIWNDRARLANIIWLSAPTNSKSRTPARCLSCGHEWNPTPSNINQGSGCPQCPKNRRNTPISDEAWEERAARVNIRWIGGVPRNSKTKHEALCLSCGHAWSVNPSNVSKGTGCPSCAKNAPISQSIWDERAQALDLEWLEPVLGRHAKARIKCLKCAYEWSCEAGAVAQGSGCPKCSNLVKNLKRRLPTSSWIERAKKLNLEWIEFPTNNSEKKQIRCLVCRYEWSVIPSKVAGNTGCPMCAGTVVTSQMWLDRAESVNITWLDVPTNSRVGTRARCNVCGLVWKPVPDAVRNGSGCPDCAVTGYKSGQPGLFYLVERSSGVGRSARKIGITNLAGSKVRTDLWRRQNFLLIKTISHESGQLIYELEQQVLRWLRLELNLPQYLDSEEMPLGGATETFDPDYPTHSDLVKKIDEVFRDLLERFMNDAD